MPSSDELMSEEEINKALECLIGRVDPEDVNDFIEPLVATALCAHALDREVRELKAAIASAEHACRRLGEDIDRDVLIDIADSLKAALAPGEKGKSDEEV